MIDLAYAVFVALGVTSAALAARLAPGDGTPPRVARAVRLAAVLGGVAGAYLFELPADLLHWTASSTVEATVVGGRTVLGGLLGGWLAVELAKWKLGHPRPTGDRFALPLALGLAFGRYGCVFAGCCPGAPIYADSPLARIAAATGQPGRFPASWVEACFHAMAACALVLAGYRGALRTQRLAVYLAAYGLVRFGLETRRANPEVALGLTYYQGLALVLFVVAASTWWRRRAVGAALPVNA